MPFTKTDPQAPEGFYESEAAGLAWLADARAARVVGVVEAVPGRIRLAELTHGAPTPAHAREFGRALAAMHDSGAPAFGSPPTGWDGPCFIGARRMSCEPDPRWGRFYVEQRVMPYVDIAEVMGQLGPADIDALEDACAAIASGAFDDDEPPSRLHGDLWNGNVFWTPDGVTLIDPAAHGGHRETDLAMLDLFGVPFQREILAGYEEQHPLAAGWRHRIPLHQLFPLAVHAAGHGPSYGVALGRAARLTLRLADVR